ncbi:hypothetical protein JXB41_03805 [Candidatus Woesearchaeota archaeon]|nr:hypothetical protein [Candidatus Woesearchaeota archaeon]
MGTILNARLQEDGKVVYEICVDKDEALRLKGNMEHIHLFAEDASMIKSRISLRGKNEATKYFLIPRELRKEITTKKEVSCQKIKTKYKDIFIYIVDKIKI